MSFFEDYTVGERIAVGSHTVTREGIIEFASRWDPQPLHTDEAAASLSPYGGIIASGCHLVAIAIRLISGSDIGASVLVAAGWDEIRFLAPVRPGDTLSLMVETVEARPSRSKPDRGIVRDKFTLTNQQGEKVLGFTDTIFVARRPQ